MTNKKTGTNKGNGWGGDKRTRDKMNRNNPRGVKRGGRRRGEKTKNNR